MGKIAVYKAVSDPAKLTSLGAEIKIAIKFCKGENLVVCLLSMACLCFPINNEA